MSKRKLVRDVALRVLVVIVLLGGFFVQVGVAPALALGTPQIVSVNPPSPAQVGTSVTIRARVDWDSDFRCMRMRFGNEGWQESCEIEYERTFSTGHLSAGWYTIRVEAARHGDDSWSNATSVEASYQLVAPPQPTQPPAPPHGPNISQFYFSPPGGSEVGSTVGIHIKVDSTNPGAIRIYVPCGNVAHFEHTVPEYDTTWSTSGCGAGTQTVRVCARDVNDPNWANPSCTEVGYSLWAPAISVPSPSANFWSDASTIQAGQCTWIHWTTSSADSVSIDGSSVALSGDMQVCPTVTKHYSLSAVSSGGQATRSLSIVVSSQAPSPSVTSSFHTGDIIQIGYDVFVIVNGERRLVPNPDTLDALGITRSWINNRGFSDSQLQTILGGQDIPDVNRDYAGFIAFKNAYFPNTGPIVPATVTPVPSSGGQQTGGFSFSVSPASVVPGGTVTVSWSGFNPTGNDWITLHPAGGNDQDYIARQSVTGSSGSLTFTAPTAAGEYYFALYRNGPKFATSERFQVVADGNSLSSGEGEESSAQASGQASGACWDLGMNPPSDWWENLFTAHANSAEELFYSGQCTYLVAQKRQDVAWWIGGTPRHAYLWDDRARTNGGEFGVVVDRTPNIGDIAVWERGCEGASSDAGHVAYVTYVSSDGRFIRVDEQNWPRPDPDIRVNRSCMNFISQPSGSPANADSASSQNGQSLASSLLQSIIDWLESRTWWPF